MLEENSIYPRIKTGYACTIDMNDELVEKFITANFTQGSAILKIKFYNPKNLIVQHLPVEESEKKIEINRMRNGYIIKHLTSVDIQEILKIGGRVEGSTKVLFIGKFLKLVHLEKLLIIYWL